MAIPIITIKRFCYSAEMGTFGELELWIANNTDKPVDVESTHFQCYTVERPWLDNQPGVSCIPEGHYSLRLGRYNRGDYPAYEVTNNPPGRSLIKIHIANVATDVMGCIGLGQNYRGNHVEFSKSAYDAFMFAMGGAEDAELRISQVKGAL